MNANSQLSQFYNPDVINLTWPNCSKEKIHVMSYLDQFFRHK